MRHCLLTLMLFLAVTGTVFAQVAEASLSLGDSRMSNNSLGQTTDSLGNVVNVTTDTNFHLALRFTINSWMFFGHEFGYAYNRGHLDEAGQNAGGMAVHQGFYDFLAYATPAGSRIRPFAAGGVQFSTFYPPGTAVFAGDGSTKFGFNYGGGLKVKLTGRFLARLDVRDYVSGKPDFGLPNESGLLNQLEVSGGLGIMLF